MAFRACGGLKSVNIPSSVKTIGAEAFNWCDNLEELTLGTGINKIAKDAFNNCDKLSKINVPATKSEYYKMRLPEKLHKFIVEMAPQKKAKK